MLLRFWRSRSLRRRRKIECQWFDFFVEADAERDFALRAWRNPGSADRNRENVRTFDVFRGEVTCSGLLGEESFRGIEHRVWLDLLAEFGPGFHLVTFARHEKVPRLL